MLLAIRLLVRLLFLLWLRLLLLFTSQASMVRTAGPLHVARTCATTGTNILLGYYASTQCEA